MEIEMELRQLKDENQALRCRYKEAESWLSNTEALLAELQDRIKSLDYDIQFLKGQIEAYQFCVKTDGKTREQRFLYNTFSV